MDGLLKVTPEKLMSSSEEFAISAKEMHSLTDEMLSLINSLKGIWVGEANDMYNSKFNSLSVDMDKLYRMIQEHSSDLSEMANKYAQAENENTQTGTSLNNAVVV